MSDKEKQKKHYDQLLILIEEMLEKYTKYKEHPEDHVEFGVIAKEELGKDKERTAYTQLRFDISKLNFEANN
ncbi:MAG: hypothetical protein IIA82_07515 [Thaumarchaeota archaeon]|nr:hypothetical protein [Nitrososphaerota archaeon]